MWNEEEYEKVLEKNYELLNQFGEYLQKKGLKVKTINKHLSNLDLFFNRFLPLNAKFSEKEIADIYDGPMEFDTYFGDWYIRKFLNSTVTSLKSSISSIKKFYRFLYEIGKISKSDLKIINDLLKESKDEWIVKMQKYNNGEYFDEDELW